MAVEKKLTLQSIFDAAWQRFVVEKSPPGQYQPDKEDKPNTWRCGYMTSDGRRCAVGAGIPDGHPALRSEEDFAGLVHAFPDLFVESLVDMANDTDRGGATKLCNFQERLHDSLCSYGNWSQSINLESEYRKVAEEFGLTVPGEGKEVVT